MNTHPNDGQLTPRVYNLPHVFAKKFAKPDTYFYDELVAEGYLALVESRNAWRPDGGTQFSSFAYNLVRMRILSKAGVRKKRNADFRWKNFISLSAKVGKNSITVGDTIPDNRQSLPCEDTELIHHLMSKVRSPVARAIYWLRETEKLKWQEICKRVGRGRDYCEDRYKLVRKRLTECKEKIGRKHKNNLKNQFLGWGTKSQREGASAHIKETARARRILGLVPSSRLYFADDGNRVIVGTANVAATLFAWISVESSTKRMRDGSSVNNAILEPFGMRLIRGVEARILLKHGYSFFEPVKEHSQT